jgi:dienelactone hydrolase
MDTPTRKTQNLDHSMKTTVLLLHEIYGVTDNLRALSSSLRSEDYDVILPSLYPDGYTGTDEAYSYNKFFADVGIEKALDTVSRITDANTHNRLVIIGFSIGATLAWLTSTDTRLQGIIGFYGSRIRHYPDVSPLVPTRLFFCQEAGFNVDELIERLNTNTMVQSKKIAGSHGFYSKNDVEAACIQEADKLMLDTLKRL